MLFYMALTGAFLHGQDDVEGDVFGGIDLGGGWLFSEWFGVCNVSGYPWIFHNEHRWQYVFEGENDGELYLYDLQSEDWWFTSESIYPSFFSFGRRTWNHYFRETVNPRQFVDLESREFWSLEIPNETEEISERAVLEALYEATGGPDWADRDNWRTDLALGEWYGVDVDHQGRVISIDLFANNLTGEIPAELGTLANLEDLDLSYNSLAGEIPEELGSLANLLSLDLGHNDLTGEIPEALGALDHLERLDLVSNDLTGEIPAELGTLANLERLGLHSNNLTGEIPAELGALANLRILGLNYNSLAGEIPEELGLLANLDYLYLSGNDLTGEIPWELGSLDNLGTLVLSGNNLTGEIPVELSTLPNLWSLDLSDNDLTGEIPVTLRLLGRLFYLNLSDNDLNGEIPVELGKLENLQRLDLSGNKLTGGIQAELGGLKLLRTMNVSKNPGMSGELPASLTDLHLLEVLLAHDTGLCAPSDSRFQDWLAGLRERQVMGCST